MFWFNKKHPNVVYMDIREVDEVTRDRRKIQVHPDVKGDFRNMPFPDNTFRMVVFDPPHLRRAGDTGWLAKKYGKLNPETWQDDLRAGFSECFRVLIPGGFLIFKWNEQQIPIHSVIALSSEHPLFVPEPPLFGQRKGKTHWLCFMKPPKTT
jgi:ubiquinone/menaquinone biosynthesis C-methylase UbiE